MYPGQHRNKEISTKVIASAKVSPNNHGNLCDIGGHGDGESLRCNVYP